MDEQCTRTNFEVAIDDIIYEFDIAPVLRENGSPFFSRNEAIAVRNELRGGEWRFPTLPEMEAIFAITSLRMSNPSKLSGRFFAAKLGVDTHTGVERISGVVRSRDSDVGFNFWTDPVLSPGYVCITDSGVSFGEVKKSTTSPAKARVTDDYDDGYDVPDSEPAYCILLIRAKDKLIQTN